MKIKLATLIVNDQDRAEKFYTEILGFTKKQDFQTKDSRWLTVSSCENLDGVKLLLELDIDEASKAYQQARYNQGIVVTAFEVEDVKVEYERLKNIGVKFITEPEKVGDVFVCSFDDTCGNLISIMQG